MIILDTIWKIEEIADSGTSQGLAYSFYEKLLRLLLE
jgi:hypothetical protein